MTNNITTDGKPIKPILTCSFCSLDTGGNHADNCPAMKKREFFRTSKEIAKLTFIEKAILSFGDRLDNCIDNLF